MPFAPALVCSELFFEVPEDLSLKLFLPPISCSARGPRSDGVISDTIIDLLTYLLTYKMMMNRPNENGLTMLPRHSLGHFGSSLHSQSLK